MIRIPNMNIQDRKGFPFAFSRSYNDSIVLSLMVSSSCLRAMANVACLTLIPMYPLPVTQHSNRLHNKCIFICGLMTFSSLIVIIQNGKLHSRLFLCYSSPLAPLVFAFYAL